MTAQLSLPFVPDSAPAAGCRMELGVSHTSWYDDAGQRHVARGYPRCLDLYWPIFVGVSR